MKHFFILRSYLSFYFNRQTKYQIHSPFVFRLLTQILTNKSFDSEYQVIKKLRKRLKKDPHILKIDDFGAGTRDASAMKIERRVSEIAKRTSVNDKFAKMLFRLVRHFEPKNILEFGTSLGISSAIFALASPKSKVYTMEGSSEILETAKSNFESLGLSNIKGILGNFDHILADQLNQIKELDLVFFDGNHRKEPTISYFEQCLPFKHKDSIFIFDDIHWSKGMQEAWEYIKNHPETTVCIDLFFMGIVFFKSELSKQEFMYKL